MPEDEAFLRRWSRRKLAAKQGEPAPTHRPAEAGTPEPAAEPSTAPTAADAEASAEAAFAEVDFEALDFQSDYTRFLAPGVPEAVKNRALRKLWQSDPLFTAADPYQDYQGDYTDAALAVPAGTLRTAYRIGRGFLSDAEVAALPAPARGGQDHGQDHGQDGQDHGQDHGQDRAQDDGQGHGGERGDRGEGELAGAHADVAEPLPEAGITPATAGDREAILALLGALGPPQDGCAALFAEGAPTLIACRAGTLLAFGALLPGAEAMQRIAYLAVARSARGAGIGTRMLACLEAAAQKQGARSIQLSAHDPAARAFFCRRGYGQACPPDRRDRGEAALTKSLLAEAP